MDDSLRAGLAAYRISRLIVDDEVFDAPRARLHYWLLDRNDWVLRLISCGYCVSVWVSGVLIFTRRRPSLRAWMVASGVAALAWSLDRIAAAESA